MSSLRLHLGLFSVIISPQFGVALFVLGLSMQSGNPSANFGPALLVLPRPGIPVSLKQLEEHSRQLKDGSVVVEVVRSEISRDSEGRVRIQSKIEDSSGSTTPSIDLFDPVAGSRVLLLPKEKMAYRMPFPRSTESRFGLFTVGDPDDSLHRWRARTENAGVRTIEHTKCEGTLIIQTAEDEAGLKKTVEQWYSNELKLIALVVASSPGETYTVRIQELRREEPDAKLFKVPSEYAIIDLSREFSNEQ